MMPRVMKCSCPAKFELSPLSTHMSLTVASTLVPCCYCWEHTRPYSQQICCCPGLLHQWACNETGKSCNDCHYQRLCKEPVGLTQSWPCRLLLAAHTRMRMPVYLCHAWHMPG
jgi:hypothetical protein